jgi:hypothetical protein
MVSSYLSKSDFIKYQLCPSYFWLSKFKPDVVPEDIDEANEYRREQGDEVEKYARMLFPDAVLIKSYGQHAKETTEKLVNDGVKSIMQATVLTDDGLLAMADVIEYDSSSECWNMFEVKSTNSVKEKHINDIAFQRAAFEKAGYKIGSISIVHLNKDYTLHLNINPKEMFVIADKTKDVSDIIEDIRSQIGDALVYMKIKEEPSGCSCRLKSKSGHCTTFSYLNPNIPDYSIFNITGIGNSKKNLNFLVDEEIYEIKNIPDDNNLTPRMKNQVEVEKSQVPKIDVSKIKKFLAGAEYPLYFLDYETVSLALPLFQKCHPYQIIPFQYSLHIMTDKDSPLLHYEYLARRSDTTPSQEMLEQLKEEIGDKGSVVVWSSYEKSTNTSMKPFYPEYADFLETVNNRLFDLETVFSQQMYMHPDFHGRSSIKAILPVLDKEFSYKDLEIQNGLIAPIRWYDAVFNSQGQEESDKVYRDLLEYCKLDTLAMVKIFQHLVSL